MAITKNYPFKLNLTKLLLSQHIKILYLLQSGNTSPLQKIPITSSNKDTNSKNNGVSQDIEEDIQKPKTHKNKNNTDDNGKPSTNSKETTSNTLIMSQVKMTMKNILNKEQGINMENQ